MSANFNEIVLNLTSKTIFSVEDFDGLNENTIIYVCDAYNMAFFDEKCSCYTRKYNVKSILEDLITVNAFRSQIVLVDI